MASELSKRNNDELFTMLRNYTADEFSVTMPRRLIKAAFEKSKAVKTELERRLSSRPEVPESVKKAANLVRVFTGDDPPDVGPFDPVEAGLIMADWILSLSPATPEGK